MREQSHKMMKLTIPFGYIWQCPQYSVAVYLLDVE